MPNKQKHRGAHPEDAKLFTPAHIAELRQAIEHLSYLLSRDYPFAASIKLVGDRFRFSERQRQALQHSVSSRQAVELRRKTQLPLNELAGKQVIIDGYNQLIPIECALSGAPLFIGLDGCYRDIASIHSTYRKVEETLPAIELIGSTLQQFGVEKTVWVLDSPVSNSGRLKMMLLEVAAQKGWNWDVLLEHNPDKYITQHDMVALSSDSWVLDRAKSWVNFTAYIIDTYIKDAWIMDLQGSAIS